MDPLEILIGLYVGHTTAEIEDSEDGKLLLDAFPVASHAELVKVEGYGKAFATVKTAAHALDRLVNRYKEPAKQVDECVRLLRRMLDEGRSERTVATHQELIEGRLYGREWKPEAKKRYDEKKGILHWKDFFMSYTNRDAPTTNARFRKVIKAGLGTAPSLNTKKGQQENEKNQLARAIVRRLRGNNVKPFFDEDELQPGDKLQEKVDDYCARSFTFVQLVEKWTLKAQPPKNWCFHEYREFSKSSSVELLEGDESAPHFFVVAGSSVPEPAGVPEGYGPWLGLLKAGEDELIRTHIESGDGTATLDDKLTKIATAMLAIRKKVIARWLS